jgi:hypothetical protein
MLAASVRAVGFEPSFEVPAVAVVINLKLEVRDVHFNQTIATHGAFVHTHVCVCVCDRRLWDDCP